MKTRRETLGILLNASLYASFGNRAVADSSAIQFEEELTWPNELDFEKQIAFMRSIARKLEIKANGHFNEKQCFIVQMPLQMWEDMENTRRWDGIKASTFLKQIWPESKWAIVAGSEEGCLACYYIEENHEGISSSVQEFTEKGSIG